MEGREEKKVFRKRILMLNLNIPLDGFLYFLRVKSKLELGFTLTRNEDFAVFEVCGSRRISLETT